MIGRIVRRLRFQYRKTRTTLWLKQAKWQSKHSGGKLSCSNAIFLDCPIRCDGAGKVIIENHVSLGFAKAPKIGSGEILLQARTKEAEIHIGMGTHTSNNISIVACSKISIGKNCQIGDLVSIYDCDFHEINPETRNASTGEIKEVVIGQNVWLGSRVLVLKGVNIGDNSVVAAGSVVTKSIPARTLAAGIPAKVIRNI